jgi:NTE family protein
VNASPKRPEQSSGEPQLGLALSGGAARAVAHIGVLQALAAAGLRVDCVAGSSGGALVGALYAAGMPLTEIERLATSVRWTDLVTVHVPRLGFLSSRPLAEFVRGLIGDVTFSELDRPFAAVATNLATGEGRVFTSGRVATAVRASCAIPQIFSPCEIEGELYVDGGIVEFMPVAALATFAPAVAVGVNLGAHPERVRRPRHILQLIMQITTVVARQNMAASEAQADVVLRPDLSGFGPFALERARDMIAVGRVEAERCLPEIQDLLARRASPLHRLTDIWRPRRP